MMPGPPRPLPNGRGDAGPAGLPDGGCMADFAAARSGRWLLAFFGGGVGEEVIDHAVQQRGELVAFLRRPVRQGGLHAGGARPRGYGRLLPCLRG